MKSALRRALAIADDIDNFRWGRSVDSDPDAIYYGTQFLRELAIRLRTAAQPFNLPELRNALEHLQLDLDGSDFGASVTLAPSC